jgi:hypothetical protein
LTTQKQQPAHTALLQQLQPQTDTGSHQQTQQQSQTQQPISQQPHQQELRQQQPQAPIHQSLNNGHHPRVEQQAQDQAQGHITQRDLQTTISAQQQPGIHSTSILKTPYEKLPYPSFHKMQHASAVNAVVLETSRGEPVLSDTSSVDARDGHPAFTTSSTSL